MIWVSALTGFGEKGTASDGGTWGPGTVDGTGDCAGGVAVSGSIRELSPVLTAKLPMEDAVKVRGGQEEWRTFCTVLSEVSLELLSIRVVRTRGSQVTDVVSLDHRY